MLSSRAKLLFLFLLSGASGLIYQVVWVRQFGNLFGSSVYSASVVTATFMLGLGAGSYLAGVWIDRRYDKDPTLPLRVYGYFELAIAILGTLLALVLPAFGEFYASKSTYVSGAHGWNELSWGSSALRYVIAFVMLTPVTTLMGGTLTLLIRHLLRTDLSRAGWDVSLLYGMNTLGAALGCLATDALLIPSMGLLATQTLAAVLNLVAGLGALWLARQSESSGVELSRPPDAPSDAEARPLRRPILVAVAILLTGFAAMGMEIIWFRHLIAMLLGYRAVFSSLLTVILLGTWLGALLGGALTRRFGRPVHLYAVAQALFVCTSFAGLAAFDRADMSSMQRSVLSLFSGSSVGLNLPSHVFFLWFTAMVIGVPTVLMGFAYPLANAIVQKESSQAGRRAGLLYLSNTLGAVLGALVAGFVLLPGVGTQSSVTWLAVIVAVAFIPLALLDEARKVVAIAAAVTVAAIFAWSRLPSDQLIRQGIPEWAADYEIIAHREGVQETIFVAKRALDTRLITNGHSMSATHPDAQRYMRLFVHLPMLHLDQPKKVAVICFGVGATLDATRHYPSLENIELVDISKDVLEHAKYFTDSSQGPIADRPNVHVYINDGRQHLRMEPEDSFDLITAEPPPIDMAGIARLYSVEMFELIRSRLRKGGIVSYWLPALEVNETGVRSTVAAFTKVFPDGVMFSGHGAEFILLAAKDEKLTLDPDKVAARLAGQPELQAELDEISAGSLRELFGTFTTSSERLRAVGNTAAPMTDDFPINEYSASFMSKDSQLPSDLFGPREIADWCPKCGVGGIENVHVKGLGNYLGLLDAFYQTRTFLTEQPTPAQQMFALPNASEVIRNSVYLRRLFDTSREDFALVNHLLKTGKEQEAIEFLETMRITLPGYAEVPYRIGGIFARQGRVAQARALFEEALALEPTHARAKAALDRLTTTSTVAP